MVKKLFVVFFALILGVRVWGMPGTKCPWLRRRVERPHVQPAVSYSHKLNVMRLKPDISAIFRIWITSTQTRCHLRSVTDTGLFKFSASTLI